MIVLETWIHHPVAIAIGRTLLHSLWEAGIVAIVLAVMVRAIRSSHARYAAACAALLAIVGAATTTLVLLVPHGGSGDRFQAVIYSLPVPGDPQAQEPARSDSYRIFIQKVLPWIAPLWAAGVLFFNFKQLTGWLIGQRLRRRGVCSVSGVWQDRLEKMRARIGVSRAVTLLESSLARIPIVIGHMRPAILLPVGLLAGLPAGQVELILMHELAHIRRFDYVVNMLQAFVEGLLFYHPAVWWVSRVIRTEREHCCDDLVVASTHDPHGYAAALAALEENRSRAAEPAVAVTGGNLVKRIRRLLGHSETPVTSLLPLVSIGFLVVVAATLILNAQPAPANRVEEPAPTPAPIAVHSIPQPPAAPPLVRQAPVQTAPSRPVTNWIEVEVPYIIAEEERQAFLSLQTDEERGKFIEQFWLRRDPTPGTPENEFKDEHYNRTAYANQNFTTSSNPGWKTDRGRIYIMFGKPDRLEFYPAGGFVNSRNETRSFPSEIWTYSYIEGVGNNVTLEFVDTTGSGDFRQLIDPAKKASLESAPQPVSVVGAVGLPGIYQTRGPKNLLDMLSMAQGLTPTAGNTIQVVRAKGAGAGPETISISVQKLFEKGRTDLNIPIGGGDVINVLYANQSIFVVGEVIRPGEFQLRGVGLSVLQAIALAGGFRPEAGNVIQVIRSVGPTRETITIDKHQLLTGSTADIRVDSNDVVFVPNRSR